MSDTDLIGPGTLRPLIVALRFWARQASARQVRVSGYRQTNKQDIAIELNLCFVAGADNISKEPRLLLSTLFVCLMIHK